MCRYRIAAPIPSVTAPLKFDGIELAGVRRGQPRTVQGRLVPSGAPRRCSMTRITKDIVQLPSAQLLDCTRGVFA